MNALTHDMSPAMTRSFTPDPADTRSLRDAFGQFATGVTIVTCASDEGPVGITANSFSSLSLDPALVMWAVDRHSRRFGFFEAAERFAIHVLSEDQLDLCNACAKDAFALREIAHEVGAGGVPLLDGALARFECTLHAMHEAGDHMIIVGQVERVTMTDGEALAFWNGKLGQVTQS